MASERDKPARYRERAAQLRAVAADLRDESAKKVLLATAEDYELMALDAERAALLAGTTPKSKPPRDI
jgi:hypothetical protein